MPPHDNPCPDCHGHGQVQVWVDCEPCNGTGEGPEPEMAHADLDTASCDKRHP